MPLKIDIFVTEPLETNTYLLRFASESWVIDPGMGLAELIEMVRRGGPPLTRILITHGHGDHIAGIDELKAAFPAARVSCSVADAPMLMDAGLNLSEPFGMRVVAPPPDELIECGGILMADGMGWEVLDTSGHSPGGVSYYCSLAGAVFTGDALFAGSIGRTDIPGGSITTLLGNIQKNLLSLPDATRVFPGHGPSTSIGQERHSNPYLGNT
ncbi:MAG: MBL fold metallo-hydrolase [Phycisphaerae bacterium]|jgi:glyoxylase-like metal-dependent hydrolase (beta-lactamase superfamily II)